MSHSKPPKKTADTGVSKMLKEARTMTSPQAGPIANGSGTSHQMAGALPALISPSNGAKPKPTRLPSLGTSPQLEKLPSPVSNNTDKVIFKAGPQLGTGGLGGTPQPSSSPAPSSTRTSSLSSGPETQQAQTSRPANRRRSNGSNSNASGGGGSTSGRVGGSTTGRIKKGSTVKQSPEVGKALEMEKKKAKEPHQPTTAKSPQQQQHTPVKSPQSPNFKTPHAPPGENKSERKKIKSAIKLSDDNDGESSSPVRKQATFSFGDAPPPADGDFTGAQSFHVNFDAGAKEGKKVQRRSTVASERISDSEIDNFVPEVIDKDPEAKKWLIAVLEDHDLFSHLEDFELNIAVDAMSETQRGKGETLYEEAGLHKGEPDEDDYIDEPGDMFFVVGGGSVEISVKSKPVRFARKGDTLQDQQLLYGALYAETATVHKDETTIFTLDRKTYKCVLSKASKKKREMYEGFLRSVNSLKSLSHLELLQLADALKPATYQKGQKLIHYGQTGETFFLIVEGVVTVFGRNESGESMKVCDFSVGDCVGELEFIHNHNCVADVVADSTVRVAKMNRRHFEMVMGPVKEVLARNAAENEVFGYYREQLDKIEKEKSLSQLGSQTAATTNVVPVAAAERKCLTSFAFGDECAMGSDTHGTGDADDEAAFAQFQTQQGHFAANAGGGQKVKRRPTVASERISDDEIDKFVPEVNEKEPETEALLTDVLAKHDLFSHLDDRELKIAVDAMTEAIKGEGEVLYEEAGIHADEEDAEDYVDEPGDGFYVVASGRVQVSTKKDGDVRVAEKGDVLQEAQLLYGELFKETATVLEDETTIYALDRKTYRCILSKASKVKREMYETFLGSVNSLKSLSHLELLQLADALKPATYQKGEKLISYGQAGETFYLIVEGVVTVIGRDDKKQPTKVCDFSVGDCVGELEFIHNHNCVADVVADSSDVRVAKMNRRHFEMVMGPVKEVLARNAAENEVFGYYREQLDKIEKEKSLSQLGGNDSQTTNAVPKKE